MERFFICSFVVLCYHADGASESSCGDSRNVTGVLGGDVTLHVDLPDIRDISWVTLRDPDVITMAVTKPGNIIENIVKPYRGRLKATSDGSLVITNLTGEDQGSYKANIRTTKQCTQVYNLTVYDKVYDNVSYHNSSEEFTGRPQHLVTMVVPAVIIPIIIVSLILLLKFHHKLHLQDPCESEEPVGKEDEMEGPVFKINDVYYLERQGES